MKKILILATIVLMLGLCVSNTFAQNVVLKGKTFVQSSPKQDSIKTDYEYQDRVRRYTKISTNEEKAVIVPHAKPSYYTRCWGKLIQITEMQAAILRPTGNVIMR